MKKIIFAIFSVLILSLVACDKDYETEGAPTMDDARVIRVSIDVRDVHYDDQRTFYNHDAKEVIVQVLPGKDWTTLKVFVTPSLFSTMSPDGGQTDDWSSGSKSYTIKSGDGSATNTYTVKIVEVEAFGNNHPWG
ncbi:MAG: hypothetical protein HQ521_07395 [Bacteroidetes bacterium]|nr:hypothetical protein [Bacteroidota bacterium]